MGISALIAWLTFANGVYSNNYAERVATDTDKIKNIFHLWTIAVILLASQRFVYCRCAREDSEPLTL